VIIVGIDIAKNNHEATIIDSVGNIIGKSFKFSNSHKGSSTLINNISHHFTALGAVARKMLYIIHSVLKNNKPYEPIA